MIRVDVTSFKWSTILWGRLTMRGGTPHIIPRNVSSGKRLALLVHANWQWGNFCWGKCTHTPQDRNPRTFLQSFALTVNLARDSHDSLAR